MTQTKPPPPPTPPPPPPARTGAPGAPTAAPTAAPAAPPRRVRDTPSRMRLLGIAMATVALVVGLVAAQSFWAADAALDRAAENSAQLVRLQDVQTRLVRADALATNAFLVGGLEPVDQREEYDAAVERAGQQAALAASAQPADGEALAVLTSDIQSYVGTIELARANNRQAFPVGAQYLRLASAGLRAEALPVLATLRDANEARAEAEFSAASQARAVVVVVGLVGLALVVLGLVWLARRTHRYVNLPLAGAGLIVLVVLVVGAISLGAVAGTVAQVQAGPYAQARALSDARIAAFDAKSNESLTLISRGSGAAFEAAWVASSGITQEQLAVALDAGSSDLAPAWDLYAERHAEIRALDDGGAWDDAVAAATSREDGTANAAFDAFDTDSAQELDAASAATSGRLVDASSGLVLAAWLCVLGGLAAAALAWFGLAQRIEEYR